MPNFGTLQNLNLREVWPDEARDFTPWLAENLDRLSQAIGIQLQLEGSEVRVEQFSADILARDPNDQSLVLIENQLDVTDHTHLGQILTYLAGLEARTVVWIARDFQEPHLSAIRWLNNHTADKFAFFAIRVRVVRIADSPMVPTFEVVERPSGWERIVRAISHDTSLSEVGQFRRDFWAYYGGSYSHEGPQRDYAGSYVRHPVEGTGIMVTQFLASDSVGLYLTGEAWEQVRDSQDALSLKFDVEIGEPDSNYWASYRLLIDSRDRENWQQMVEWLHETLCDYRKVVAEVAAKAD